MLKRHRSNDGHRETEDVLGDKTQVSQQGRDGGRLARVVGTKDEEKRSKERPAGVTRVVKSIKDEGGDNDA